MEVNWLYGLILVLIIFIIYLYRIEILSYAGWTKQEFNTRSPTAKLADIEPMASDELTLYERRKRALLDETKIDNSLHMDNREFFEDGPKQGPQCDDISAPDSDFNGSGLSFSDYVKSAAVDPEMVENHSKYVTDIADRGLFTGRTYTPDMHDSYNPIPWVGLNRPQNVPVGNPDTIPDVDRTIYSNKQSIRF